MNLRQVSSMATVAVAAAAVTAVVTLSITRASGQPATGDSKPAPAARPARIEGKPNMSGIWQALNEANWDLEAHAARPGAVTQPGVYPFDYARVPAAPVVALGAAAGVPASLGVVQDDGRIPYTPGALAMKRENAEHWIDRDPELKCYLPGIPRAMYLPYPFEITQSTNLVHMSFAFTNTARTIHLDQVEDPPADTWMGHSVGHWEGDTLVVNVNSFNDKTWFDRAGNFHSEALHVTERFSLLTPDVIWYEAMIEDPSVFTRAWRIAMPLYRRMEPNIQLLEYQCIEFVEEFLYGNLRKTPLVTHWEGETMSIDVKRKIPQGDAFYAWFRK
jgi:hypothetical protein